MGMDLFHSDLPSCNSRLCNVMHVLSSIVPGLSQARLSCLVATESALKVLRGAHLVGVVLVVLTILGMKSALCFQLVSVNDTYLLVVELLSVLSSVALGLLFVDVVKTLGLDELVNLSTSKGSNELLGELVVDRLALGTLSLLESVHGSERGTTSKELVGDLALVLVVIDLVVGVVGFTCNVLSALTELGDEASSTDPSRTL